MIVKNDSKKLEKYKISRYGNWKDLGNKISRKKNNRKKK